MKKINVDKIKNVVTKLCEEANFKLRPDISKALKIALKKETNKKARSILQILLKNAKIAFEEKRALCQDTGIVCVYIKLGDKVSLIGDYKKAINKGVEEAYRKHFLRKSVVNSPLKRENTYTNTPAIIYTDIVKGSKVEIIVMPKGFGSENKSKVKMMNPTVSEEEIVSFVVNVVKDAGPDACPPYVIGVGLGGTFDKACSLSKEAILYPINKSNRKIYLRKLQKTIMEKINKLNIGPMGLGGKTTSLGVNLLEYPTHIAGFPVAVNVSCHITRSAKSII